VKAQTGSGGIILLIFDPGAGKERVVSVTFQPLYPPGMRSGTHFTGKWVGLVTGLDESGNIPPTGVRSPDAPGRSGHPVYQEEYRTDICLEPKGTKKNHEDMQLKSSSLGDYNGVLLNNSVEALTTKAIAVR